MEINKKTLRALFGGIIGCIVIYWLLHEPYRLAALLTAVWQLLSPFAIGAVLAFILNVPMRAIERNLKFIKAEKGRRALAIVLTLVAVLLVVAGAIRLLVPQVVETVETLIAALPRFFENIKNYVMTQLNENPELMEWLYENTDFQSINWSGLIEKVISWATASLETIFSGALTTVITLGNGVFDGVVSLVFGIYCLAGKETLARQGRRAAYAILKEPAADEVVRILRMSNATFSNFISGQVLEAIILGCMFAISMSIFKMPYMPLVSVVIAITALVPIVGAFVGCILGAFFILVTDPVLAFWFVIMFLVLQQIEGNLIYPRVVGTSVGLPGMWVLLAVAVGGDLMGVGGMLLFIPLSSVLYALAREYSGKLLTKKGIAAEKLENQPMERKPGLLENRKKKNRKKKAQTQPVREETQDQAQEGK